MRRFSRWLNKRDIIYVFFLMLICLGIITQTDIDKTAKGVIVAIYIPLFLALLKTVIDYRLKSDDADIEVIGCGELKECIVWKESKDVEYPCFLIIVNSSDVIVQKIWGKIKKKYEGQEYSFELNKQINPSEEVNVGIPFEFTDVESVWISSSLKYQKITKKFFGEITGLNGKYIWAESEYYYGEKYCLTHSRKKENEFIRLKRFWL